MIKISYKNQFVLLLLSIFVFACTKTNNKLPTEVEEDPVEEEMDSTISEILATPKEIKKTKFYESPTELETDTIYSDLGEYGPFPIGSTWEYKYREAIFDDVTYEVDSTIRFFTVQIKKDTLIDGMQFIGSHHTKDGVYLRACYNRYTKETDIEKYIDTNLNVDDTWETDWKPISLSPFAGLYFQKNNFRIREKNKTMEVNGKIYTDVIHISEFRMHKFEKDINSSIASVFEMYYAKGIGLIYQYEPRFNWTVERFLIDYDIK